MKRSAFLSPICQERGTRSHHDDQARLDAHARLMGRLGVLVRSGLAVPCLDRRAVWAANDDKTAQDAARACLDRPALGTCRAYITAHREPAGTWAGLTEKQRTTNRRGEPTMNKHTTEQTARLEATAVTRLITQNRQAEAQVMLNESENPIELAHAACGMAAALVVTLAPGKADMILDNYTQAALAE